VKSKNVGAGKVAVKAAMIFTADDVATWRWMGDPLSTGLRVALSGSIKGVQLAIAKDAERLEHHLF
jgi:hypothetical protein